MNAKQVRPARRDHGFTLIEIMVVVVIIGLLAAIIAPNIMSNLSRAEITAAKQEIRTISGALDQFRIDFYRYPTTDEGLAILTGGKDINNRSVPRFIDTVPIDPWGRPYLYEYPSRHGKDYDLYTLGADGQENGEGTNADIGNWNLE
ncbi:MAG: type II secretion system major pseudopilin GspG [Gammaproteobacteria bacterium]